MTTPALTRRAFLGAAAGTAAGMAATTATSAWALPTPDAPRLFYATPSACEEPVWQPFSRLATSTIPWPERVTLTIHGIRFGDEPSELDAVSLDVIHHLADGSELPWTAFAYARTPVVNHPSSVSAVVSPHQRGSITLEARYVARDGVPIRRVFDLQRPSSASLNALDETQFSLELPGACASLRFAVRPVTEPRDASMAAHPQAVVDVITKPA